MRPHPPLRCVSDSEARDLPSHYFIETERMKSYGQFAIETSSANAAQAMSGSTQSMNACTVVSLFVCWLIDG